MIARLTHRWRITSENIRTFGSIVGDANPVHVDPEYAAKTRFKSPIAHGMTSLVFMNQLLPKEYEVTTFMIRFMKPIYPG